MTTSGPDRKGLRLSPFRGLRYVPERVGSLAAVTSPPYDVVVRPDGLRHLETADPHNIVRVILPQADGTETRSHRAAETLRRWLAEGVLAVDPEPAIYVYEQRHGDLVQRGLIGTLPLSGQDEGVVLPHEDVMPQVVEERADLMRATAANLEPLLLTYRSEGEYTGATAVIDAATRRTPLLSTTTEDGFGHRLWSVTDPAELAAINADLAHRQALIADGHHRWATYLRLRAEHTGPGPWDSGLVLLVDTARYPLVVRAIHRVLHRLGVDEAVAALDGLFRVRTIEGPLPKAMEALATAKETSPNAFVLAGDGTFRLLDRPDTAALRDFTPADRPEEWRTLDATVLHAVLLEKFWKVPDDPDNVGYIHDTAAAVEQAERRGGTAVLMHPVREEVVRDLARQGVRMPRKSTSFGPKPATGLVLRSLEFD